MNTAIKHDFKDPILNTLFNEQKAQGVVSNLTLKSVDEILLLHSHWTNEKQRASNDKTFQAICDAEMNLLNDILRRKREISTQLYGAEYLKEPATYKLGPARKDSKAIETATPEEKETKVVTMNQIPGLGEKPDQKLVAETVKSLLIEGKPKEAEILARKHYGKGDYTPKNPSNKAEAWSETKLLGWLKDLSTRNKPGVVKETPKSDDPTISALKNRGLTDAEIEEFGKMGTTLDEETKALDNFSVAYSDLAKGGSEDVVEAELMLKAFFLNRKYHEVNIQKWIAFIMDDNKTDVDHWEYLGVPGREEGLLGGAPLYKELEEAVVEKIKNGMSKEQIIGTFKPKITGKVVLDDKNANYPMYTHLHATDFLELLFDENYTANKPTKTDQSKGEVGAQKGHTDKPLTKENVKTEPEEKKVTAPTEVKEPKSSPVQKEDSLKPISINDIKTCALKAVRNGGILDDVILRLEERDVQTNGIRTTDGDKVFENIEDLKEYLTPIFNEVENKYEAERVNYPFGQMMAIIRQAEENDISIEDCVKDNVTLIKRKDGAYLKLISKDKDGKDLEPIIFKSDDDFKTFVTEKYAFFVEKREAKKLADEKKLAEIAAKQENSKTVELQKKVDTRLEEAKTEKSEPIKTETPKEEKKFSIMDNMIEINDFKDIEKGKELIDMGATMEDLKQWGRAKLLNNQLPGMDEKSVYKTTELVDVFIEGYFKGHMDRKVAKTVTLTKEDILNEITSRWEQEGANLSSVAKYMKEYLAENNHEMAINDLYALIKQVQTEVREALEVEETEVLNKVSESDKDLWKIVENFTKIAEIYNQGKELCEAGDWQKGLSMALELIVDNNQITDAENWTDEQVVTWYNQNFKPASEEEGAEVEEAVIVEEKSTDTEESKGEWDFSEVLKAGDKNIFKRSMQKFVEENDMTKECRDALVNAIKTEAKGSHTKKIGRDTPVAGIHTIINNTMRKAEEAAKAK